MANRVYEKLQEKGVPFVHRSRNRRREAFTITPEELGKVDLDEIMAAGGPASTAHVPPRAPDMSNVPPGERAKAFLRAGGVKKMLKSALSPASLLTDATIGAGVGAGSALLGYESARPRSAGIFTPPNPRYEGVIDPATIERIAEQGEIENELERRKLIQQYNALGYDIDPNTRLRDLRR
jgi:hypothetical protein